MRKTKKSKSIILLSCLLILCITGMGTGVHAQESRTIAYDAHGIPHIAGEIIVQFHSEETPMSMVTLGFEDEQYQSPYMDAYLLEALHVLGYIVKSDLSHIVPGMQLASIDQTVPVEAAVEMLERSQYVAYAEPNYLITLDPVEQAMVDAQSSASLAAQRLQIPNDPLYSSQWGLTKIQADKVWGVTTGRQDTIIAVIDTGIDYNHPDLAANIWREHYYSWNFVSNNADPMDDNGHGTHIAGIIGAVGNNGIGIAGVNWNVKIMPLKIIGADGNGDIISAVSAIHYAQQVGADIISSSFGIKANSQALADVIRQTNVLFVVAAGNEGANNDVTPYYPSNLGYNNMIVVTATDTSDQLASLSNHGQKTVNVAAPGVDIVSTSPANGYAYMSGTSMATSFVSGIAGLMLSVNPGLSPAQLKSLIIQSVDGTPSLYSKISSDGRVNAEKAVNAARGGSTTQAPTLTKTPTKTPTFIPGPITPFPTITIWPTPTTTFIPGPITPLPTITIWPTPTTTFTPGPIDPMPGPIDFD